MGNPVAHSARTDNAYLLHNIVLIALVRNDLGSLFYQLSTSGNTVQNTAEYAVTGLIAVSL
jgi:hypothetical protein